MFSYGFVGHRSRRKFRYGAGQRFDAWVTESILPVGYNFAIAALAADEYVGIVRYYVYNLLGHSGRLYLPAHHREDVLP
jgi:hypothetical protein